MIVTALKLQQIRWILLSFVPNHYISLDVVTRFVNCGVELAIVQPTVRDQV